VNPPTEPAERPRRPAPPGQRPAWGRFPGPGAPWSDRPHPQKGGPRPARPAPADGRLDGAAAGQVATQLERLGWRAEAVPVAQGLAKVEVRALAVRGMPLVATLRTQAEVDAFLLAHPEPRPPGPRVAARPTEDSR
jgi:hypothetical protein